MFGLYSLYPSYPQPENWRPEVEYVLHRKKLTDIYIVALMGFVTFRIVAIHGLGGHPIMTWGEEDKLWLRDLLPGHLPAHSLRISSFGYDSAVFGRSRSQISHYAEQLLNDLHQRRREVRKVLRYWRLLR